MESELNSSTTTPTTRWVVLHVLRAHPFVSLLIAGLLVGGGLRFVPATSASDGSGGAGQTACAAK